MLGLTGITWDKKHKILTILCLIYGIWHFFTNWTTTLLSFLQWDTIEPLTIVDLAYIQAIGSLCNAIGSLAIGQMTDSIGPKAMFIFSVILTSLYFIGLGMCRTWYSFLFVQFLRIGYQLDSTTEMYLATVTTESERTRALMILTIPQAMAMFFAPIIGSKVAVYTSLRTSQMLNGVLLAAMLIPAVLVMLPTTHSIPRLAAAKLRPQEYWPMIMKNKGLREGLILRGLVITSYVCYELIARNYLLRSYMHAYSDNAEVLITMGASLVMTQFVILPFLQRHNSPKVLLQMACVALILAYGSAAFIDSLYQYLVIVAIQTGAYAIAYAESSTQITCAVQAGELGKATGLASMVQWTMHFLVPIYTSHIATHWNYTYAFYTSAILMTITLGYITAFAKETNARLRTLLPTMTVA